MTEQEIILCLQFALDKALTGGNHIASNLISLIGVNFNTIAKDYEGAMHELAVQYPENWMSLYDQWCCWKAMMEARDMATSALAEYNGEVLGVFKS